MKMFLSLVAALVLTWLFFVHPFKFFAAKNSEKIAPQFILGVDTVGHYITGSGNDINSKIVSRSRVFGCPLLSNTKFLDVENDSIEYDRRKSEVGKLIYNIKALGCTLFPKNTIFLILEKDEDKNDYYFRVQNKRKKLWIPNMNLLMVKN